MSGVVKVVVRPFHLSSPRAGASSRLPPFVTVSSHCQAILGPSAVSTRIQFGGKWVPRTA